MKRLSFRLRARRGHARSRSSSKRDLYSRQLRIEPLEDRRMLSAITWMNRFTFSGTDDNHFDEAFNTVVSPGVVDTTKRDEAIAVVDAVILKWERVIDSFNYVSPSTYFQVNISMTAVAQGNGGGTITAT